MKATWNAEKWKMHNRLVVEHEELKRQYDLLQENFYLVVKELGKYRLSTSSVGPVDNSEGSIDKW